MAGVTTNSQPIVGAYGDIYTAEIGTPAPSINQWDNPPDWTLLGMISEDGATWTPPEEETSDIRIWQSKFPARVVTTSLTSSLGFALDAWDRVTVPFALGGGSFEDAGGTIIYHPPGPGESVSKAIFMKVLDGPVKLGLYFPKGRVTGRDDSVFKPDEPALLNVTFSLEVSTQYDPYQLIFDPATFPEGGVVATGATAGAPGTFTPAGASAPADLAALAAVTANPATAWTTGQFVTLADASEAFWDGDTWEMGRAS